MVKDKKTTTTKRRFSRRSRNARAGEGLGREKRGAEGLPLFTPLMSIMVVIVFSLLPVVSFFAARTTRWLGMLKTLKLTGVSVSGSREKKSPEISGSGLDWNGASTAG